MKTFKQHILDLLPNLSQAELLEVSEACDKLIIKDKDECDCIGISHHYTCPKWELCA